jgi:hypothetical protein
MSKYMLINGSELENIWKVIVRAYFKVLSLYLPVKSIDNCKRPQSG